jgi:hypothetical protein
MDANALVALTAERFEAPGFENWKREKVSFKTNTIIQTLEAIANIAIYEPKGQVVAVALQKDNERKLIRLTIAQSNEVPKKVIDHIEEVWEMLRELSDEYLSESVRKVKGPRWPGYTGRGFGDPLLLEHTISEDKEDAIAENIYKFSERRLIARAEKSREDFCAFARAFLQAFKQGALDGSTDKKLQEDFYTVIVGLFKVFSWGDSKPTPPIQDWNKFISYMRVITYLVDKILETPGTCETWMKEVNGKLVTSEL